MTLTERIDRAIDRIIAGHSPQRIPADLTDPDIVLTDCKARIAELEAELADAVDYGRGRHEAERRAEEAEQALATVTRERDEARASAGVLLDAFHGVLEALADSEGILEGITGDARGMAVAQLADNHRAVTAFTAALSSPASDWLAARDRRVAEMQREACARVVDRGVREDNGDTGQQCAVRQRGPRHAPRDVQAGGRDVSIKCVHYRTAETECGVCYPCVVTSLRAEVERLKKLTDRPAWWTQVQRENDALRAEVERLRAKGEALAKAMRGGMHAAFAQGGESVECACSSCTNRRAALAEWEKP